MKNKNIILSVMIVSITLLAYSAKSQVNNMQHDSVPNKTQYDKATQNKMDNQNKMQDPQMQQSKTDHVMMQNGKMMVMKEGKMMPMEKDMSMKNGTKCMTDGTCVTESGKRTMMKEGEMMDMNGNMMMILIKDDKTK